MKEWAAGRGGGECCDGDGAVGTGHRWQGMRIWTPRHSSLQCLWGLWHPSPSDSRGDVPRCGDHGSVLRGVLRSSVWPARTYAGALAGLLGPCTNPRRGGPQSISCHLRRSDDVLPCEGSSHGTLGVGTQNQEPRPHLCWPSMCVESGRRKGTKQW